MKNITLNTFELFFITSITAMLLLGCTNTPKQKESNNKIATKDSTTYQGCKNIITDRPYDIPAQRFDVTAQQLAHASGCFIKTDLSKTGAIRVNAVKGTMSIRDAVRKAIEDTDLKMTKETSEMIVIDLADSLR